MENEEIYEEINIDTINENINSSDMDITESETETVNENSSFDVVESLLLLLEEWQREREEEQGEELLHSETTESGSAAEVQPVLIQNVDNVDYTELLLSIDEKLDMIATTQSGVLINSEPHGIYTPIDDYSLSELFMVIALIGFGAFALVTFIKNNVFHLR